MRAWERSRSFWFSAKKPSNSFLSTVTLSDMGDGAGNALVAYEPYGSADLSSDEDVEAHQNLG